ncbi:uncharacterized protein LOC117581901 [Drosophila guanche]|uniref:Uncharacterized protein n=1 Tax=Drosophila guanche TaxID=7266 RepID=A0A3B0J1Z1_DROGU|nr:uncharacterized protein LOC117581901 [Drosophila guanche]SPP72923.1 Hypothetical predicted protein [Drosophila guanche]
MLMQARRHINVTVPLMVMVLLAARLHPVCGTNGDVDSRRTVKLRRDQDDWLALPPLNVKKPVASTDRLFQQVDAFDRLDGITESSPARDLEAFWGFGRKSEKQPKENKLNFLLNYSSEKKLGTAEAGANTKIDELFKRPQMKKPESAQQLEQHHRQMDHFKNVAADLAFERMMNSQQERKQSADAVFIPLFTTATPFLAKSAPEKSPNRKIYPLNHAAKPSWAITYLAKSVPAKPAKEKIHPQLSAAKPFGAKPVPAKPGNSKIHLLSKAKSQKPALPRPSTCAATTPKKPPSGKGNPSPKPKPLAPSKAQCKDKKEPPISGSSAKRLELEILGMKKHLLSILKTLNVLEMEVLSRSPDTCPRHHHKGKGMGKGNAPKKKTKIGERLDRPNLLSKANSTLHPGFVFGIRPAGAKEKLAALAAARSEELKLRGKVWQEHLQHLMARKRPYLKPKRYEVAPPAAARLEPVDPKPSVVPPLNHKSLLLLLKSRPTSAPVQQDRMPVTPAKHLAIRNYELLPKKLNGTKRHPAPRMNKKRKKKKIAPRPTDRTIARKMAR